MTLPRKSVSKTEPVPLRASGRVYFEITVGRALADEFSHVYALVLDRVSRDKHLIRVSTGMFERANLLGDIAWPCPGKQFVIHVFEEWSKRDQEWKEGSWTLNGEIDEFLKSSVSENGIFEACARDGYQEVLI